MFEIIYVAFFGLMIAEVVLFLFLNLPIPKLWKSFIYKTVKDSQGIKTFLKVQILLCILAGLFYIDLGGQEKVLSSQKKQLRNKNSMGACK